jgi:hypothetical protein
MPTIHLTKGQDGRLVGVTEADNRAYGRFISRCLALTPKESLKFTWAEPRSGPYHRRHFAMLHALFESQEQYDNDQHFRKIGEMGAGYADMVPGPGGVLVAVPRSINYEALDQVDFEPIHKAVFEWYRSEVGLKVMWPHLSWQQAYDLVDRVLREFE